MSRSRFFCVLCAWYRGLTVSFTCVCVWLQAPTGRICCRWTWIWVHRTWFRRQWTSLSTSSSVWPTRRCLMPRSDQSRYPGVRLTSRRTAGYVTRPAMNTRSRSSSRTECAASLTPAWLLMTSRRLRCRPSPPDCLEQDGHHGPRRRRGRRRVERVERATGRHRLLPSRPMTAATTHRRLTPTEHLD